MPRFHLTLDNYFSPLRPHVSRTMITDYLKSPEYFKKKYIDRTIKQKFTAPMQKGSMVDAILTRNTNPYEYAVLKKEDPETFERQKTLDPAFLVTKALYYEAMAVVEEVKRQPYWQHNIENALFQTVLEGTLEGVLTCGLPDRIDPLGNMKYRMVDLKVVNPIKLSSPRKWLANAQEAGYIHQAALYQYLFAKEQGIPITNIQFAHVVAASVSPSYATSKLFIIPQELIDEAMLEVRSALQGIKAKNFEPKLLSWDEAVML